MLRVFFKVVPSFLYRFGDSSRLNEFHPFFKTCLSSTQEQYTVESHMSRFLLNTFIMCHIFWELADCRINFVKIRSQTNCKSRVMLLEAPCKDFGRAEQGLKMSLWVCFNLWKCGVIADEPRSCLKVPDLIQKNCIAAHSLYLLYTVLREKKERGNIHAKISRMVCYVGD